MAELFILIPLIGHRVRQTPINGVHSHYIDYVIMSVCYLPIVSNRISG